MLYYLELLLDITDVKLTATDRLNNLIILDKTIQNNLVKVSAQISMPNVITLDISKSNDSASAILKSAKLGYIKFQNNDLTRLFVYHHEYGINRSCDWIYNGKVQFEFFEQDPIAYHLILGTKI
jgi:hypothetical protein